VRSIRSFLKVLAGKYEAGLIIHEGQLTYSKAGLQRVVEYGQMWQHMTGCPSPWWQRHSPCAWPELMLSVSQALRESIQYALDNREEALAYACSLRGDLRHALCRQVL